MSGKPRHLRPLRPLPPSASLDFCLMGAVQHFDKGQWMAGVEALCDAIEQLHLGDHEPISSDRLNHHLRQIRGPEITPRDAA